MFFLVTRAWNGTMTAVIRFYVYLPEELATYITNQELRELKLFDKKYKKIGKNWTLYFDDEKNVIAKQINDDDSYDMKKI